MVLGSILFSWLALLGYWGCVPPWGVAGKDISNGSHPEAPPHTDLCPGKPCYSPGNKPKSKTDHGPVSRYAFDLSAGGNVHKHRKRATASGDSDEEMDMDDDDDYDEEMYDEEEEEMHDEEEEEMDDEDEEMYDYDGEEFLEGEDPWYRRAIEEGKINQQLEDDNLDPVNRPFNDPEINRDGDIVVQPARKKVAPAALIKLEPFWRRLNLFDFFNHDSYTAIKTYRKDDRNTFITTTISIGDGHMAIAKGHILTHTSASWDFLAACWAYAQEEAADRYGPASRLDYVSIEKIRDETTINQIRIARDKWFGSGERGRVTKAFIISKSLIPFESLETRDVWLALRGTTEINAVIMMIQKYPNRFHAMKLSSIYLEFDSIDKPTAIDVALYFEWPVDVGVERSPVVDVPMEDIDESDVGWSPPLTGSPHSEEITDTAVPMPFVGDGNVDIVEPGRNLGVVLHPLVPDILRTTYTTSHGPTFKIIHAKYRATNGETNVYIAAFSRVERQLAFIGFENGDFEEKVNVAQANKVLGEVLFAVWHHEAGPGRPINGLSFSGLSSNSQDSITAAFKLSKGSDINSIQTFNDADPAFPQVLRAFLNTREGKATRIIVQRYEKTGGNLNIQSLQYGKYTEHDGSFIYITFGVGFIPQLGGQSKSSILKAEIRAGIDEASIALLAGCAYSRYLTRFIGTVLAEEEARVKYPASRTLLGSWEGNKYETREGRTLLRYISPAEEHMVEFTKIRQKHFLHIVDTRVKEVGDFEVFKNKIYFGSVIGPKGKVGATNNYTIAANWDHMHLVVLSIPEADQHDSPPLEDILFAAWLSAYGPHGNPVLGHPTERWRGHYYRAFVRNGAPVRYFSFLEVSQATRRIIERIFRQFDQPLSTPICAFTRVFYGIVPKTGMTRDTAFKSLYRGPAWDASEFRKRQIFWLIMLATPEVKAVSRLFNKYQYQASMGLEISEICLRWRGAVGEERPEILVTGRHIPSESSLARSVRVGMTLARFFSDPEIATVSTRGVKVLAMQLLWSTIKGVKDEPLVTSSEYSFQMGRSLDKKIPTEIVHMIDDLRSKFSRNQAAWNLPGPNQNPYFEYAATSKTERITYNLYISPGDRHIILPKPFPQTGLDPLEQCQRTASVLAKVWHLNRNYNTALGSKSKNILGNHGKNWHGHMASVSALRTFTFLKLSSESSNTIAGILSSLSQPAAVLATRRRVFSISNDGEVTVRAAQDFFIQLHGLEEICALSRLVEGFGDTVFSRNLLCFYITGKPGNFKIVVNLGRTPTESTDWIVGK
ncbi:hypothetical protein TWF718_003447 [Orbilia javanica]|uniref:Uncharacterized protein n=1 Tax=Orbilia javanica TaxID=47235 RepID=A0AAN8ML88_9PEZI